MSDQARALLAQSPGSHSTEMGQKQRAGVNKVLGGEDSVRSQVCLGLTLPRPTRRRVVRPRPGHLPSTFRGADHGSGDGPENISRLPDR
jgi:hypothetical protein